MQAIIVLGNRKNDIMKKRVDCALKEFYSSPIEYIDPDSHEHTQLKYLLFSGGSSDGKSKPEGSVMMEDYALKAGVDKRFIQTEINSRDTIQNLIFSRKLLDEINTETYNCGRPRVTICTSSFHIKRVIILSSILLGDKYQLDFIHTNEEVTPDEKKQEWYNTIRNVDSILDKKLSK